MITREAFLDHLTNALYHLYEPDRLGQNPLAGILGVTNRPDSFAAFQQILMDAIESLAPGPDEPSGAPAWEVYEPLFHRYVQRLNQEQVARQLGMSVRHLRRKEHAAVEVLAARLWQQYHLEERAEAEAKVEGALATSPSVAQELAWLRDTPPERPVDLGRLLPETLELAGPLARQYGIRLEIVGADGLPAVPVHEVALSQLVLNLLGIAIACAEHGVVSLSARSLPEEVEIRIQGQRLEAGARPEEAARANVLDIADQLVQLCGGRLAVADEPGGFSATLALPGMGQVAVLVVDDNADTLQLVRRYVVGTRYQLVTAQDPTEVVALAEQVQPEIVVLDVMMPRTDGWRLLTQLRQQPWADQAAIIVCTILPQQEMALALGADGFLQKPVTRTTFLSALDRQVERMARESH